MEKRYLVVGNGYGMIGAFEGVEAIVKADNGVAIKSSEGEFIFTKDEDGVYSAPNCSISFTNYRYIGKRAVKRMGVQVPDNRSNKGRVCIVK